MPQDDQRSNPPRRVWRRWLLSAGLALAAPGLSAIDSLDLAAQFVEGASWNTNGVALRLTISPAGQLGADLTVESVDLPVSGLRLTGVHLACPALELALTKLNCPLGRLALESSPFGAQDLAAEIRYDRAAGRLELALSGLQIGGSTHEARLDIGPEAWTAWVTGREARIAALQALLARLLEREFPIELDGRIASDLTIEGGPEGVSMVRGQVGLTGLGGSNETGKAAAEGVDAWVSGRLLAPEDGGWRFDMEAEGQAGQLYLEPVFIDLDQRRLRFQARGEWRGETIDVHEYRYDDEGSLMAHGSARVSLAEGVDVVTTDTLIERAALPGFYVTYLRPYLFGTPLSDLESAGSLTGRYVRDHDGARELSLTARDIQLDERNSRFAVYGIEGNIDWRASEAPASHLRWKGGFIFGVSVGASALALALSGSDISLLEPAAIPLLDGRLDVRTLELSDVLGEHPGIRFDARLAPLGLRALTRALDWPPFAGTLSGSLPMLTYRDGELIVGGRLEVEAFDGAINIDALRIVEPFGSVPKLSAQVIVRGVDLERLTETFSFGRVTGRLNGELRDLELVGWTPVAFDARIDTPTDDRSRHRISQRAIENLSSLGGGGATAVLSSGFLRFFRDFGYSRIGLGCRLHRGVCDMDGLEPAPGGGYYIVKGRGLPRIDVIGHADEVSWLTLLQQIRVILEGGTPVIR